MASLQEKVRVARSHGVRNTMTDYGARQLWDMDDYEEQRDRIRTKIARLRYKFERSCECGHTDNAMALAIDLAYWQSKLTKLSKRVEVFRDDYVLFPSKEA